MSESVGRQIAIIAVGSVLGAGATALVAWGISLFAGDVPAWMVLVGAVVGAALGWWLAPSRVSPSGNADGPDERIGELNARVHELESSIRVHAAYVDHLSEAVATVKGLEDNRLPMVRFAGFVEHGILGHLQRVLTQEEGEEIRVSVLMRAAGDDDDFVMPYAIGHSIEGRERYRRPIDKTLAGIAFRTGKVQVYDDVETEQNFVPNPEAKRAFASLLAVPLTVGGETIGVLSAVSTVKAAFPKIDQQYVEAVTALLALAWNLPGWQHSDPQDDPGDADHPDG